VLRLLATTFHFFGARLYFPTTFDAKRHLPLAVSVMDYEEMTNAPASPTDLISELNALAASATSAEALMKGIVAILHGKLTRYNWVGFYMLEKEADHDMLVLGPFQGTMTPHTRIPLNQGICGAAASRGKTIVVDDVAADARYLACSLETKSEIVVPVFLHGKVTGELDIDSHFLAAFGPDDRKLCEHAAALLGKFLERSS
jgi:L-methionine (R)-S-oxide reductase